MILISLSFVSKFWDGFFSVYLEFTSKLRGKKGIYTIIILS